jgi:hypothetical protein
MLLVTRVRPQCVEACDRGGGRIEQLADAGGARDERLACCCATATAAGTAAQ